MSAHVLLLQRRVGSDVTPKICRVAVGYLTLAGCFVPCYVLTDTRRHDTTAALVVVRGDAGLLLVGKPK